MNDSRINDLTVNEPSLEYSSGVKIDKIKFKNYKFFHGEFELPVNGKNLLVYGENGSGKSSVYKALELLTKNIFTGFANNLNIFAKSNDVEVEFSFTDESEFTITPDTEEIPEYLSFLNGLSVFAPFLDYKKLLNVHYATNINGDNINLYSMFRILLKEYPTNKGKLKDFKDVTEYFESLKKILKEDMLDEINRYLQEYFKADITLTSFNTKTELDSETEKAIPMVNLNIDYKNNSINKYHKFLNEARLSALAISIYMVAIKKLLDVLEKDSLKMLVLDDLLISLDMSNRLKLLEILKNEFSDFQIFFFTHDKELYEIYKDKMKWEKYEIYLDDSGDIPKAILKQAIDKIKNPIDDFFE